MARTVLVLEEVLAFMQVAGIKPKDIDRFQAQAEAVLGVKVERVADDHVTVASGFGQHSEQGFVELTLNDQRSQMDVKKAREIGLMLIECAEAAASDEMFVKLLAKLGLDDAESRGRVLLDLREIRQGTRGTSWPS